jgi:hypothetical protein
MTGAGKTACGMVQPSEHAIRCRNDPRFVNAADLRGGGGQKAADLNRFANAPRRA